MSNKLFSDKELVSIARDFAKAAINKQDDLSFEDRVIAASSEEEAFEILGSAMDLADMKRKLGANSDSNQEYVEAVIQTADKLADIYSRFCTKQEISAMVPAVAAQDGVAEAFVARGAKSLAKLCLKP